MAKRDIDILLRARDQMSGKFGRATKKSEGLRKAFVGLKMAAIAAAAAIALMAAKTAKESLEAYAKQEAAEQNLSGALALVGEHARAQVPMMKEFAAGIQQITTQGDEATLELMAMGASMGKLSGQELKDATTAAIGLAKAYKMDTVAAMRLVARAALGDTASLSRYGIKLDESLSKQEKFNAVLKIGKENFALAEAETKTYGGAMQQIKNMVGDVKESIGEQLAPIVIALAQTFKEQLPAIKGFALGVVEVFKNTLRGAIVAFTFMEAVVQNWKDAVIIYFKFILLGWISLAMNIKHFCTEVIPAYLTWLKDNWRQIFETMWNALKSFTKNIGKNLAALWRAIRDFVKGKGWHFQWTGLLDGFESTLKEMPKIAERQLTGTEKKLVRDIRERGARVGDAFGAGMDKKVAERIKKMGLGVKEEVKASMPAAVVPGGAEEEKAAAAPGRAKTFSAFESRFLTRAPGADPQVQSANHLKKISQDLGTMRADQRKQRELQEEQLRQAERGTGTLQLKAANL